MRIARTLIAAALMAFAALAFAATASAEHEEPITNHEEPMEVVAEGGAHCSDIVEGVGPPVDEEPEVGGSETMGGCPVEAHGEFRFFGHFIGFESTISDCNTEFNGRVDEEGEGWLTEATLTDHTGINDCTVVVCPETNHMMRPWPVHAREDTGAVGTQEWIAAEFCVIGSNGTGTRYECEVEFPIIVNGHNYSINGESQGSDHLNAPNCEVEGSGSVAAGQIELEHDHIA